jgi:hypothetical protein
MPSPLANIIHRPEGKGWLVLTGGIPPEEQIQRVLALVQHAGSILGLVSHSDSVTEAETILEEWLILSGWPGKIRAIGSSPTVAADTLLEEMEEATILFFLDSGDSNAFLQEFNAADLQESVLAALDDGSVIVASGAAADALGEVLVDSNGLPHPGLGWIPAAVIQARFQPQQACPILTTRPGLFRFGIPEGAALALGPEGERELWGAERPTLTFGIGWDR